MDINRERLMNDLKDLGAIGYIEGEGASRMAYSQAFFQGRDLVKARMQAAGLSTAIDAVGNLTGLLPSATGNSKKRIAIGSHIDTVPKGGIYDGALGVLAAIEVIRVLRENGYANDHPIEVIAFNEEEGNVIGGTFGSKAFAGAPLEVSMIQPMGRQNISEADFASCKRSAEDYLAYLEYHIEQGGILEASQKTIGIVQGIFGILRYRARVTGMANHAGSTPMSLRDDALEKTCCVITDLMDRVRASGDTMVCTVGTMALQPGAVNVIPGQTEFIIELRDKTMTGMYQVIDALRAQWEEKGLSLEPYITQPETLCDSQLCALAQETAQALKLPYMKMYSGAGHDLINTSFLMPALLLFIPSRGGISHHMDEYSSPEDIRAGAHMLLELLKKIDKGRFKHED